MTKQRRHRKKRREHELCAWEGCPEVTGDEYHCPKHKQMQAVYSKRSREKKEQRP